MPDTFPITMPANFRRTYPAASTGTYVVCLDCGKELPYDWNEMKFVRQPKNRNRIRNFVAKEAP